MRRFSHLIKSSIVLSAVVLASCTSTTTKAAENPITMKEYTHKYGYPLTKNEFEEQKYPGQVTTILKDGSVIVQTYENGVLHGQSTRTFPHSKTIQYYELYKDGNLVKEMVYDIKGMPIHERVQLSPSEVRYTKWYIDGVPMCVENYQDNHLDTGQYFTKQNEIESRVEKGEGIRIVRNPQGQLIAKEEVKEGHPIQQQRFYSNENPQSISHYLHGGILNGERKLFTETGEPLQVEEYVNGKLHGKVIYYENGTPVVETHYENGMKNGIEKHYVDGEAVSQEIIWVNDKKHGPATYLINGQPYVEYFYQGAHVSEQRWEELSQIDQMISKLDPEHSK